MDFLAAWGGGLDEASLAQASVDVRAGCRCRGSDDSTLITHPHKGTVEEVC